MFHNFSLSASAHRIGLCLQEFSEKQHLNLFFFQCLIIAAAQSSTRLVVYVYDPTSRRAADEIECYVSAAERERRLPMAQDLCDASNCAWYVVEGSGWRGVVCGAV